MPHPGLPVCSACGAVLRLTATRHALGFPRLACGGCGTSVLGPLPTAFRVTYIVLAVLVAVDAVRLLVTDAFGPFDIARLVLFDGVFVGVLVADARLRRASPPGDAHD